MRWTAHRGGVRIRRRTVRESEGTMAATHLPYPPIPYGMADFSAIRREGFLYVDKTRFLRDLENERHVFLLRPRRFGKSCWISILEHYYDRTRKDNFEALFAGTDIGREPTANRSRYAMLRLNFSVFGKRLSTLEEDFEGHCHTHLRGMLEVNDDLFPEKIAQRILSPPRLGGRLDELFHHAERLGVRLYVLIDEYDNFANTILAGEGLAAYHSMTHGSGFFRDFFATLKAGTESGSLERLFITGVSPVTMDDVTSGFNVGTNISFNAKYQDMVGFTESEVRGLVDMYRGLGVFDEDADAAMALMREWYNGYRFAKSATEDVYNTDMVLYYLKHSIPNAEGPHDLIDANVRVDYVKLRHLVVVNRDATLAAERSADAAAQVGADAPRRISNSAELHAARALGTNGNFDVLRQVIAEGRVDSDLSMSFPVEQLGQRENFLTLLHCFGLLSIRGVEDGHPRLGIPNQTVRRLMYGYLRDAYRDVGVFSVDHLMFENLTWAMARDGAWRPAVDFLADAVRRQTGVRDYVQGERLLQGFLAAYLGAASCFVFHTEHELGKGYADIVLTPLTVRYPTLRHGYVVELKYLKREAGGEAATQAALDAAKAQLAGYLADERLAQQHPTIEFTGIVLVFRGWELVAREAIDLASSAALS